MVLKRGLLRKKGILFYNSRLVTLSIRGILTYYDPKNTTLPRGTIDLNSEQVFVKLDGRHRDQLEIITKDEIFIFKVLLLNNNEIIGNAKWKGRVETMG